MKRLTVRCSDEEYEALVEYCAKKNRTQNDVLRELIRKLKKSRAKSTGL
ncbi:ribbon-helix-helix protein, CopG family [Anabaena azotica]|uniref:Ribbon-helix-helix protein, CopG family n=1 Tax=Anabaena azotica FACHB-119 TaxID=947527 RepID=A0ABR8DF33_9NOST|nr:ribbon-helix-helix protein, CopG family [Anabaena azotica]MBD2505256.1 ribbon-helix-helix protein, CopG family [Anabaena azotica FACHB-119]